MSTVIHSRSGRAIVVVVAFAFALGVARLSVYWTSSQQLVLYLAGAAAFFTAAIFLPELKERQLLSRQSALGLMGLFIALCGVEIRMHVLAGKPLSTAADIALGLGFPLLGLLSYWLALGLIRGFRARPEYP